MYIRTTLKYLFTDSMKLENLVLHHRLQVQYYQETDLLPDS